MQASVHTFDETTGSGSVLLDDGLERPFSSEVFEASALRHLRFGQRVSIALGPADDASTADGDVVTRLWVVGIGAHEPIH